MSSNSLTINQRVDIFAKAIDEGKNQSDAYRLAYPSSRKWKKKTVNERASVFAKHKKVLTRIAELRAMRDKKHTIKIERMVQEMEHTALFDPIGLVKEDGQAKGLHELDEKTRRGIGVNVKDGEITLSLSAREKMTAQEKLGIYAKHGGFSQHHVLTGPDGGPIEVNEMSKVEMARHIAFILRQGQVEQTKAKQ